MLELVEEAMLENKIEYIRFEGGVYFPFDWVVYKIYGRDRERFLNGQTTNDVVKLKLGESQISCKLDHSGRIQSYFYLYKDKDFFLALIPRELAEETITSLNKYIIADDVSIEKEADNLNIIIGPVSRDDSLSAEFALGICSIPLFHAGEPSLVVWGESLSKLNQRNFEKIDDLTYQTLLILSGFPRWNIDIDHKTLFNESFLENMASSYTKGCYLGQETVNKIKNFRGASYFPILIILEGEEGNSKSSQWELPKNIDENVYNIYVEEKKVGTILSKVEYDNKIILVAKLLREYRIENKKITFRIQNSDDVITGLCGKTKYLPYFNVKCDSEKAIELYDEANKSFLVSHDVDKAIELLKYAIGIDKNFYDAYEILGVMLDKKENYDAAIEVFKQLNQLNPSSVMPHTNLSRIYMKLGRKEDAEYEKALSMEKSLKGGQNFQTNEKNLDEENIKRESLFKQVLEIDENDIAANFGMGEIMTLKGNIEEAKKFFYKIVDIGSAFPKVYLSLANILIKENNYREAKGILESGIKIAASKGELSTANEMHSLLESILGKTL